MPTCSKKSDSLIVDEVQVAIRSFVVDLGPMFDCSDPDGDILTFTLLSDTSGLFEIRDGQSVHRSIF